MLLNLKQTSFFLPLILSIVFACRTVRQDSKLYANQDNKTPTDNIIVVYNQHSDQSLEIAEYYSSLRNIPKEHLFAVNLQGLDQHIIDIKQFKNRFIDPLINFLDENNLRQKVTTIAYSIDIPTAVNVSSFFQSSGTKVIDRSRTFASVNSLTFYYQLVLDSELEDLFYINGGVENPYYTDISQDAKNFSETQYKGKYLLSAFLGVSRSWFSRDKPNTVEEIKAMLQRSYDADNSNPDIRVAFVKNADVRTSRRDEQYARTNAMFIENMGHSVTLENFDDSRSSPKNMTDISGLTTGIAKFEARGATLAPGALVDNITSNGGRFHGLHRLHTTVADFIRMGASGASGTVVEPTLIMDKFPNASLHYFYAQGKTMVEAFYLSTKKPYQLLIVGDPLCRPYTDKAKFQ